MFTSISIRTARAVFTFAMATAAFALSTLTPAQVSAQATCPCFTADEIVKKCGTTKDWENKNWKIMRRRPHDEPFYMHFKSGSKNRTDGWWFHWRNIQTGTLISCSRWRFIYWKRWLRKGHGCIQQQGMERGSYNDVDGIRRLNHLGWRNWTDTRPRTSAAGLACKYAITSALKTLKSVNNRLKQKTRIWIFRRGKNYARQID